MLRLVYNCLYWGMHLTVGGRNQPLLVIVDEAHLFAPTNDDSDSLSTLSMIAKEGRKYGVGLMVVTQRPSELASTILSQVGTILALRITNTTDASTVSRYLPDELGSLAAILPTLRTGEGIFLGEAMSIPTRVRIRQSGARVIGADPPMPQGWKQDSRPDTDTYADAIANWRRQSVRGDDSNEEAD